MEKHKEHLENLAQIKSLMEQSSRFISLSGLSGVFAGIFALLGAFTAFWYFGYKFFPYYEQVYNSAGEIRLDYVIFMLTLAASVLSLALISALYFTLKRTKSQGNKVWNAQSKRMLINLAIPLFTGALFCLILILNGVPHLVAPTTLIFYGLSLLNGSKYTLNDIRYLGMFQIILGFISAFLLGYALLFWAIGFGILHIIYGIIMYNKYEK